MNFAHYRTVVLLVACLLADAFRSIWRSPLLQQCHSSLVMRLDIIGETTTGHMPARYDLWVVGAGTLGQEILSKLDIRNCGLKVAAENHEECRNVAITAYGAELKLRPQRSAADHGCARNVVICVPPSVDNYVEEVRAATLLWAGADCNGSLVYTSSIGVYGDTSGTVDEDSHPDTRSSTAAKYALQIACPRVALF
jgi:nucleoside-diphosphate-sugar epimerase